MFRNQLARLRVVAAVGLFGILAGGAEAQTGVNLVNLGSSGYAAGNGQAFAGNVSDSANAPADVRNNANVAYFDEALAQFNNDTAHAQVFGPGNVSAGLASAQTQVTLDTIQEFSGSGSTSITAAGAGAGQEVEIQVIDPGPGSSDPNAELALHGTFSAAVVPNPGSPLVKEAGVMLYPKNDPGSALVDIYVSNGILRGEYETFRGRYIIGGQSNATVSSNGYVGIFDARVSTNQTYVLQTWGVSDLQGAIFVPPASGCGTTSREGGGGTDATLSSEAFYELFLAPPGAVTTIPNGGTLPLPSIPLAPPPGTPGGNPGDGGDPGDGSYDPNGDGVFDADDPPPFGHPDAARPGAKAGAWIPYIYAEFDGGSA